MFVCELDCFPPCSTFISSPISPLRSLHPNFKLSSCFVVNGHEAEDGVLGVSCYRGLFFQSTECFKTAPSTYFEMCPLRLRFSTYSRSWEAESSLQPRHRQSNLQVCQEEDLSSSSLLESAKVGLLGRFLCTEVSPALSRLRFLY